MIYKSFQLTEKSRGDNFDWPQWMHQAWQLEREELGSVYPTIPGTEAGTISIGTSRGPQLVTFGDWILRDVTTGELYVLNIELFKKEFKAQALEAKLKRSYLFNFQPKIQDLSKTVRTIQLYKSSHKICK